MWRVGRFLLFPLEEKLQEGGEEKDRRGQDGEAADRGQQSQAEYPPMSGYAKAAEAYRGGEAREEDSHGRAERQGHPGLVFFPLAPKDVSLAIKPVHPGRFLAS